MRGDSCLTSVFTQLISELDITGGDETQVGYYSGLLVNFRYSFQNDINKNARFHFSSQWKPYSRYNGLVCLIILVGNLSFSLDYSVCAFR